MKNRDVRLCGIAWLHPEIPFCTQTGLSILTEIGSTIQPASLFSFKKILENTASLENTRFCQSEEIDIAIMVMS